MNRRNRKQRRAKLQRIRRILYPHLAAFWPHSEASGTRADSVGGYDLTAVNNPVASPESFGNATQLVKSSSQRLISSVSDPSGLDFAGRSIAFFSWIYLSSHNNNTFPFFLGAPAGTDNITLRTVGTGQTQLRAYIRLEGAARVATCSTLLSLSTWYFVAVYYDFLAGIIYCSVNNANAGTLDVSSYNSADSLPNPSNIVFGSAPSGALAFDGKVALSGVIVGDAGLSAFKTALPWLAGGFRTLPEIQAYTG